MQKAVACGPHASFSMPSSSPPPYSLSSSLSLLLFLLLVLFTQAARDLHQPRSYQQLDEMISRCFQSVCKDWMHECHWFCDAIKGRSFYRRCLECLSWRGRHCHECFHL